MSILDIFQKSLAFQEPKSDHEVEVYKEQFGDRFIVTCEDFRTKLQANIAGDGQPERLTNVSTLK